MTLDESIAQWKADNPPPITINDHGVERPLTTAEYESMAADMGQILFAASQQQDTHTADMSEIQALTSQVSALRAMATELETTPDYPAAEMQEYMATLMRLNADMICVLNKHSREPQPVT